MSVGLLRGLAARALGVNTPLRSQRVHAGAQPAEPGLGDAPGWWEAQPQAESRQPRGALPQAGTEHVQPVGAALAASVPDNFRTRSSPVAQHPQADRDVRPAPAQDAPAAAAGRLATAKSPSSVPAAATDDAAAARVQREHQPWQQPATATASVATTARSARQAVPAPLLPPSAPPALPPPVAVNAASPGRRGDRHRQAAAEAPTEVHVSIGRVDLTALAPTTTVRSPTRREGPAGRSLAEYLRGPGAKRQS